MASPRLIYDDECGFCTWWAAFAGRHGDFELVGFSEVTPDQEARLPEHWEGCVHLLTDEEVYSCGKAIEQTVARMGWLPRKFVRLVSRLPGYRRWREKAYTWAANRRALWGRVLSRESV